MTDPRVGHSHVVFFYLNSIATFTMSVPKSNVLKVPLVHIYYDYSTNVLMCPRYTYVSTSDTFIHANLSPSLAVLVNFVLRYIPFVIFYTTPASEFSQSLVSM